MFKIAKGWHTLLFLILKEFEAGVTVDPSHECSYHGGLLSWLEALSALIEMKIFFLSSIHMLNQGGRFPCIKSSLFSSSKFHLGTMCSLDRLLCSVVSILRRTFPASVFLIQVCSSHTGSSLGFTGQDLPGIANFIAEFGKGLALASGRIHSKAILWKSRI